jgi:threonine aldolase
VPPTTVDLRSDTVTRPTAAMRQAMAEAEVGDDGYGEDPTVNRLEASFAERLDKEAAVFVPSGTMANQLALRCLPPPGTRVVVGRRQHVVLYEAGAAGVNTTVQLELVDDARGTLAPADAAAAIDGEAHHQQPVGAIFVENTHMPAGGVPWTVDALQAIGALGKPIHQDGARLFNAEVATGVPAPGSRPRPPR